jgi:hypothetical protein
MVLPYLNFGPPKKQEEEVNNPPASQNLLPDLNIPYVCLVVIVKNSAMNICTVHFCK